MSQDVGVEADQRHGNEPGSGAEPLARGKENQKRKRQREQPGSEPHAEKQALAWTVVAGQKVAAVEVGLRFEIAAFERWNPQVSAQQRQRGQHLYQRRMFGVEAVIAGVQHHVAGEDVVVFIKRERLAMNHKRHLRCLHGQQGNHCDPSPFVCDFHGCWSILDKGTETIVDDSSFELRRGRVIGRSRTLRGTRNQRRQVLH